MTPPRSRTPSPSPTDDPATRWETIRAKWLRPRSPSDEEVRPAPTGPAPAPRRARDPVFQQRIATLEDLVREANAAATAPSEVRPAAAALGAANAPPPPLAPSSLSSAALLVPALQRADDGGSGAGSSGSRFGKGKDRAPADEDTLDDELPDGGMPIRDAGTYGGQGDPVHELKKVSEGIFLAFKQGRALKEPLPLSLVTSLLFRSWFLDGTIPPNYVAEPESIPAPIPARLRAEALPASPELPVSASPSHGVSSASPTGTATCPAVPQRTPSLLAALSEHNSHAVTPLPSSSGSGSGSGSGSSDPSALPVTPPAPGGGGGDDNDGTTLPLSSDPGRRPALLTGSGPGSQDGMGGSGTLKLDVLRGSRWRTEKEIASGSDVI